MHLTPKAASAAFWRPLPLLVKCYFLDSPSLLDEPPELPPWEVVAVPGAWPIEGIFALFLILVVPPVFYIVGMLALSIANVFLPLDISVSPWLILRITKLTTHVNATKNNAPET